MKYGLLYDEIQPDNFVLGGHGSLGGEYLQPDGQWTSYLPSVESQLNKLGFDAMACVSFGTLSALEILANRIYGQTRNWSDRFLAKTSGTTKQGNSPHTVAEALRKQGVVGETDYPFSQDIQAWDEFYAEISSSLKSLAHAFLGEFEFKHEWVVTHPSYLVEALKHSPLGISVPAWFKDGNGLYYRPEGTPDNHWVCLVGYKENEYWLIYDSYQQAGEGEESFVKKLRWDFRPSMAKRYSLTRQVKSEKSWIKFLIDLVLAAFGTKPTVSDTSQSEVEPPKVEPKFKWGTKADIRHSIRVICDEEGLTVEQKNTLCATIQAESGFDLEAVNHNKKNGKITSSDWGLCQINDFYHIGPGAAFPTIDFVLKNPEVVVRWMCKQWRAGKRDWWIAYKNGSYKKYL